MRLLLCVSLFLVISLQFNYSNAYMYGSCQYFKDTVQLANIDCSLYPSPQWVITGVGSVDGGTPGNMLDADDGNECIETPKNPLSQSCNNVYYAVDTLSSNVPVYGPFDYTPDIVAHPSYHPGSLGRFWDNSLIRDLEFRLYQGQDLSGDWQNYYPPDYDVEYWFSSRNRYKFTANAIRIEVYGGIVGSNYVITESIVRNNYTVNVYLYDYAVEYWELGYISSPADVRSVFIDHMSYDSSYPWIMEYKRKKLPFILDYPAYVPRFSSLSTVKNLYRNRFGVNNNYTSFFAPMFTPAFPAGRSDSIFSYSSFTHKLDSSGNPLPELNKGQLDLQGWSVWPVLRTVFFTITFIAAFKIISGVRQSGG